MEKPGVACVDDAVTSLWWVQCPLLIGQAVEGSSQSERGLAPLDYASIHPTLTEHPLSTRSVLPCHNQALPWGAYCLVGDAGWPANLTDLLDKGPQHGVAQRSHTQLCLRGAGAGTGRR